MAGRRRNPASPGRQATRGRLRVAADSRRGVEGRAPSVRADKPGALPDELTVPTQAVLETCATFLAHGDVLRLMIGSDESSLCDELGMPAYKLLAAAGLLELDANGRYVSTEQLEALLELLGPIEAALAAELLSRLSQRAARHVEAKRRLLDLTLPA